MPLQFVNHKGARVIPAGDSPSFKSNPRPKAEESAAFHRGWVVVGYSPERMEAAKKSAGGSWDETKFLRHNKASRLRNKPYEVEAAADECARLAIASGWRHVSVEPLTKGDASQLPAFGEF